MTKENEFTIQLNEEERNIIRYCVEERLEQERQKDNMIKVQYLQLIYDKLMLLRHREIENNTCDKILYL